MEDILKVIEDWGIALKKAETCEAMDLAYRGNVCIGRFAGYSLTIGSHNVLIGDYAGHDFVDEFKTVVIGDNIRNLNRCQKDVLFIGEKVAIGKTLFGKPCNLQELINEEIKAQLLDLRKRE